MATPNDLEATKHATAADQLRRALALNPSDAALYNELGNLFLAQGGAEEADSCYREALRLQPDFAEVHYNLGTSLQQQLRLESADACYRRALELRPHLFQAHHNIGVIAGKQGRLEYAVECYREALRLRPRLAPALVNLGQVLRSLGRLQEARAAFTEALRLTPGSAQAHEDLGGVLALLGRREEAMVCFDQALQLRPNSPEGHNNRGNILRQLGKLDDAEAAYQEALRLRPIYALAQNNLGHVLLEKGRLTDAAIAFRAALSAEPAFAVAHSNLLFCLSNQPDIDANDLFAEHCRWGEQHGNAGELLSHVVSARAVDRRLRVGYVSPDFRNHAVACFVEPILTHHDPAYVEVFCYAEVANPDAVTRRLQALGPAWRSTIGLSDREVAETIRGDGIDLLVDLAGHTANHRLGAFAYRPAPVQVSYIGYPHTTGLRAIDYRLSDSVVDPEGETGPYVEEVLRLPLGACCYRPPDAAPPVNSLPANHRAGLTFGSLHRLARLHPGLLDLWSDILRALPTARLLIYRNTLQGEACANLRREFLARGIGPAQLELRHETPTEGGHLAVYHEIDVALDTYPWSGHTTACESLWMGVPVLTLRGATAAGRMAAGVLTRVSLTDWIAETHADYQELAVRHASDRGRLAELRRSLREQVRHTLCDGEAFTRTLEAAYRELSRRYCAREA